MSGPEDCVASTASWTDDQRICYSPANVTSVEVETVVRLLGNAFAPGSAFWGHLYREAGRLTLEVKRSSRLQRWVLLGVVVVADDLESEVERLIALDVLRGAVA